MSERIESQLKRCKIDYYRSLFDIYMETISRPRGDRESIAVEPMFFLHWDNPTNPTALTLVVLRRDCIRCWGDDLDTDGTSLSFNTKIFISIEDLPLGELTYICEMLEKMLIDEVYLED